MFIHCTICGDYSNFASLHHRRSKVHQEKLKSRLRQISFHISQKRCMSAVVHDNQWNGKDHHRFCHFCGSKFTEHQTEGEFIVEYLGSLIHHADEHHIESVKKFIKQHERTEHHEKYCVKNDEVKSFMIKVQEAKCKYLKKMEILHEQAVKQIKQVEKERKDLFKDAIQLCSTDDTEVEKNQNFKAENNTIDSKRKSYKPDEKIKIPPWLSEENFSHGSVADLQTEVNPIGPTVDDFLKHVANQKKKGLPANRIGADFKRIAETSCNWLPSFHGVWNKGSRKQSRLQFKRRH